MNFEKIIKYFGLSSIFTPKDLSIAYLQKLEKVNLNDNDCYKNISLNFLYLIPRMIPFNFKISSLNKMEHDNGIDEIVKTIKSHEYYPSLKEDVERIYEELDCYRKNNYSEVEVARIFKTRMKYLFFGEYKRICLEKLLRKCLEIDNKVVRKSLEKFYVHALYINDYNQFNSSYKEFLMRLNEMILKQNNKLKNQEVLDIEPETLFVDIKEKELAISVLDLSGLKLVCFKYNGQIYERDINDLINNEYISLKEFLIESECICAQDITYTGAYTILYKKANLCICHSSKKGFFVQEFYPSVLFEEFKNYTVFEECKDINKCLELIKNELIVKLNNNFKR